MIQRLVNRYRAWKELWREAFDKAAEQEDWTTDRDRNRYAREYVWAVRKERRLIRRCRNAGITERARLDAERRHWNAND